MVKWKKIIELARGHKVYIQTHNFPDPDAIASAFGLQKFLAYHGQETTICYNGKVDKVSVNSMVENFGISMFPYDELDINEEDYVFIVDCQKYNPNITDIPGDEVAVIDHHETRVPCKYHFKDVRIVGACSSLITEYFVKSKTPMDEETASALMYGIRMDTDSFSRGVTEFDLKMYTYLFPRARVSLVDRMITDTIELKDLRAYGAAIENIQIYGEIGIARIPFDCEDALVAMVSDFVLKLDSVSVSIIYAEKKGGLKFSVRSEEARIRSGILVSTALRGIGNGGGHPQMAGGFIPPENRLEDSSIEDKMIRERFLKAYEEIRPKFEAVVFDMDGVIFDTEKLYRRFEKEQGLKYGFDEDKIDILCERLAGATKETNRKVFEEVIGNEIDYDSYRDGLLEMLDAYTAENGVEMKRGVKLLLDHLKNNKIRIALATSTPRERAIKYLEDNGIIGYFDALVFGDMVKKGKPNPDIFIKACDMLNVFPEHAIGVEDSINGIKSSHKAGLFTVMVVDLIQPSEEVKKMADEIYYVASDIMNLV